MAKKKNKADETKDYPFDHSHLNGNQGVAEHQAKKDSKNLKKK